MSYTDAIGGGLLPSSHSSFTQAQLTENTQGYWPFEYSGEGILVSQLMELTSTDEYYLMLPSPLKVSPGESIVIYNSGPQTILLSSSGVMVGEVISGEAKLCYVNADSSWGTIGYGVGVAELDAAQIQGSGLKAVGSDLTVAVPVVDVSSSPRIYPSQRGQLINFLGGYDTLQLNSAVDYGIDFYAYVKNSGTGTLVIQAQSGQTIDGNQSIGLQPDESCILACVGGTRFASLGVGRSTLYQFSQLTLDVSDGGEFTLTSAQASNKLMSFVGNPSLPVTVIIPSVVSVYYVSSNISTPITITVKTKLGAGAIVNQSERAVLLCGGTSVSSAQTSALTGSQQVPDGSVETPSISFASDIGTGLYKYSEHGIGVAVNGIARITVDDGIIQLRGDVEITGALKANGSWGSSGQVLVSGGEGQPVHWGTASETGGSSFTEEDLQNALTAGVTNVLAGVGSDHVLDVNADSGFILIKHKDADTGAGAGAGYAGPARCALGLTSNGIIAGYNRLSDGAWVNSLVIDAPTGSATFTGTVNATDGNFTGTVTAGTVIAGSVIVAGASGNITLDSIIDQDYVIPDLQNQLSSGVSNIIAGIGSDYHLMVDTSSAFILFGHKDCVYNGTVDSGIRGNGQSMLAITSAGIAMGYNDPTTGVWKDSVAISATGSAVFSGTIQADSILAGSVTVAGSGGNVTLNDIISGVGYAKADLQADLDSGVASIIAGIGSDYRMVVDTANGYIVIGKAGSAYQGTATAGVVRPAIGISSAGIAMGYNRSSDGVWVNSVSISSTGSASFSGAITATSGSFTGTVTAGSVIDVSATVNGTSMSTIRSGALLGATSVQDSDIAGMLTASSSYSLSGVVVPTSSGAMKLGTITWNSTTGAVTGGSGIAFTSKGIVGAKSGVETFAITDAGVARFKGDISGATGTFSGSVSTSGSVNALGTYGSSVGNAAVVGSPSNTAYIGVAGLSGSGVGVYGHSTSSYGVYGQANGPSGVGVYGDGYSTTGIALFAGGSGRVAFGGASMQIRGNSGLLRMTDAYTTDAYMIMATAAGPGSGSTVTLGAKLGTSTAQAGWITAKVAGATCYIPYWT